MLTALPLIFFLLLSAGMFSENIPVPAMFGYLTLSLASILIYAKDKRAARTGRRRTPERTLHLLALAGGWPGAMLAQQWLRHKTLKRSFRITFWIIVVVNLALLGYLLWHGPPYMEKWG